MSSELPPLADSPAPLVERGLGDEASRRPADTVQLTAVIGYPLAHSISPRFQQPAFNHLGLSVRYVARETPPEELPAFLTELRGPQWLGVNVTVPHKEAVAAVVDELSTEARLIGAVNTVRKAGDRLIGHNTDAAGFLRGLTDAACGPQGVAALILGAGGAARAVAVALLQAGARHVTVANRTVSRAERLVATLSTSFDAARLAASPLQAEAVQPALQGADLVVNTTTVGMAHGPAADASPLDTPLMTTLPSRALIYDLVYNPAETPLLQVARAQGYRTQGGLPMLIYQGAASFELWTGQPAPVELMMAHGRQAMAERE
ncbi:MAG: shikimate dehydrogenase [Chloroflexota bacterium]|nr:shikimate dehydrogenase [Chloroflexota bacterium]